MYCVMKLIIITMTCFSNACCIIVKISSCFFCDEIETKPDVTVKICTGREHFRTDLFKIPNSDYTQLRQSSLHHLQ